MTASSDNSINFLNLQNTLLNHIWQGDFSAPVVETLNEGANVLDVGCGTGIWVTEMSKNYPLSHFIGIGDSPLLPQQTVTSNSTFLRLNLLDPFPFEDNHFDYVHCRNALMSHSTIEWSESVVPEMIRVTKPDGFIEHCEVDEQHINEGLIMKQITNALSNYNTSRGADGMIGGKLDEILLETGRLYNVYQQQKYCPLGNWGGPYGVMAFDIFTQRCRTIGAQLAEVMNISQQEFDTKLDASLVETETARTYLKSHRIYAQKSP